MVSKVAVMVGRVTVKVGKMAITVDKVAVMGVNATFLIQRRKQLEEKTKQKDHLFPSTTEKRNIFFK